MQVYVIVMAKRMLAITLNLFFFYSSIFHAFLYNAYIELVQVQYALVLGLGCCWGLTFGT